MALYIAAADPLPLIPWDKTSPAFNVLDLPEQDQIVRRRFTKAHVYYIGAHTGCACGFRFGETEPTTAEDTAEDAAARQAVQALKSYLTDAVLLLGEVELFACWDGDQSKVPDGRLEVTPMFFSGPAFALPEAAFLVRGDW